MFELFTCKHGLKVNKVFSLRAPRYVKKSKTKENKKKNLLKALMEPICRYGLTTL